MAEYLYCRISQRKQNIERQKRNLKAAFPNGIIIEEAFTGTTTARPAWTRLRKRVREGDIIAFDSVSRMSRNAEAPLLYVLYRISVQTQAPPAGAAAASAKNFTNIFTFS